MKFRESFSLKHSPNEEEDMDKILKRELRLAKEIQTHLLNGERPKIDHGEVTGVSIPARLVGGDYYDFYTLPNGKIRIIIGDVMGKGIPAAMLMILTRGAFRSAAESTIGPGEALRAMNNALYEDLRSLRSFVTVFCADWDPEESTLSYANAGHSTPILISRNKESKEFKKSNGVMLGGLPNQSYKEQLIKLEKDDFVFFYTDGIVEAQDEQGEQYNVTRLIDVLERSSEKEVKEIEQAVIESVNEFTQGISQRDDITMVILKLKEDETEITTYNSPILENS